MAMTAPSIRKQGEERDANCALVLKFIQRQIKMLGYPPTIREIGDHFGWTSTNRTRTYLTRLEAQGKIKRDEMVSRGIRVLA